MSWSNASSSSPSSTGARPVSTYSPTKVPPRLVVKSKFDSEFRRFSMFLNPENLLDYRTFRRQVSELHSLQDLPITLCYTSNLGDLLPITNDENFRKSFESSSPCLRLLIQRKGESWEEKYGYGTDSTDRRRKGLSGIFGAPSKHTRRQYSISNPEDFRQVSAIIDVDVVPETHRRVRLCKHGGEDKKLGFFIRDGTAVRLTAQGAQKVSGIFISRLLAGGLAESSGLLAVNDEVLEVNGIDVQGKTLDQVTDMMIANASNLIITTKPANQRNTLQRNAMQRTSGTDSLGSGNRRSQGSMASSTKAASARHRPQNHGDAGSDSEDEVIDYSANRHAALGAPSR